MGKKKKAKSSSTKTAEEAQKQPEMETTIKIEVPQEQPEVINLKQNEQLPTVVIPEIEQVPIPQAPEEEKKPAPEVPLQEEENLGKIFNDAYFKFDPDVDFGSGFEKELSKKIEDLGKSHQTRLVVAETQNYTNYLGLYYKPAEIKYRFLKKWLLTKGCTSVCYELSHSTLNMFAPTKTIQVVAYFNPQP